ncbi:hypothetical protein NDU88_005557 [Pleurodeles waltl]|uniref:Uncharacterized protein n=1 Tax=Pleurodeles waltl TaxID=8319 RepID=A0AAV7VM17_PLEWA|nr:hypothetical protein NDU88_005557 [Pleurodeles waltl]
MDQVPLTKAHHVVHLLYPHACPKWRLYSGHLQPFVLGQDCPPAQQWDPGDLVESGRRVVTVKQAMYTPLFKTLDPLRGREPSPPAVKPTWRERWRAERRRSCLWRSAHFRSVERSGRQLPPRDRTGRRLSADCTKKEVRLEPRPCGVSGIPVGGKWRLVRATASPRGPRSIGTAAGS